ncbi:Lrp/AsnC family transcriptional regulator [Pseudomonas fluorescens]|uniref:Lrp/AsnC family transcriptional regulator n=1 Tax=Pseudomonas fluorescens TaxID=294 RepID=UPI0012B72494|nr:Lrp/AsnC family transcriptional regulator [Pseudomonas fluorescens]
MKLDAVDLLILNVLQQEGNLQNFELARRVDLSASPCSRRVRKLEVNGVIDRYVAVVNLDRVGKSITLFVRVWLKAQTAEAIEQFSNVAKSLPEILECHLMASECHFLLKVVVPNLEAFCLFQTSYLGSSHGVRSVKTEVPMKTVKSTTALPLKMPG